MLYEGINVNTSQKSESHTIVAPVGGLNGRDALANMAEVDAYEMVNLFPGTSTCVVREGCEIHQAPVGAPVTSLETFASGTGQKLLAFAAPNVWNVTVKDVKTSLKADLVQDAVVATMFSTVADAAQFLIVTTGSDTPFQYNGTTITNLALTGLVHGDIAQKINFVCNYKLRLYFGIEGRLGFYYLPPGAIQGALEWFDLAQLSHYGGYLQAIATYSEDAGAGPDDYIIFITSRGECIVFNGLDPGDAAAWDIVGRYKAGAPIGKKCVWDYAGDLLILTSEGVQQFSAIKKLADTRYEATALSSKLGDILLDLNVNRDIHGWSMIVWPSGGKLVVNVPATTTRLGAYKHFVMNTTTQAWTVFDSREWDAQCFGVFEKKLYFGRYDGSIRVVQGTYDNGESISFHAKQAYNYFKTPQRKQFHWAQFLVKSEAEVALASRLSVDFIENTPVTEPNPLGSGGGAEWDIAYWDQDYWGYGPYTQRWIAPYGNYGIAASHWLTGQVAGATFEWYSTEHVFQKADGLL
jgi:hypothetical protein